MLGWALNKATGNASSNAAPTPGPGRCLEHFVQSCQSESIVLTERSQSLDDTFVEQPDTPAPVFAARAFKRAIFGTPAAPNPTVVAQKQEKAGAANFEKLPKPAETDSKAYESPSKPAGILLTPGTATSRRKRVSFGREVKSNAAFGDSATRPRTRLQEALENSRKQRKKTTGGEDDAKKLDFDPENIDGDDDDAWEEVDELDRDPDITVDLNDPRSQSGRYWKGEFQKYHGEARVEMEKLVKYKQLAKSYAKAKDAEALDMNERLREEQEKVAELERRIADVTGGSLGKQNQLVGAPSSRDDKKLQRDLDRQTSLVAQYKKQVKQLQSLLDATNDVRTRGDPSSLRGTKNRDLERLRQGVQRIKSDLTTTEQREIQLESENAKLAADLTKSTRKLEELERKLTRSEQDRERKDSQLEKLKAEVDALKKKNAAQRQEITTLKKGSRSSRSAVTDDLLDEPDDASAPWAKKLDELQARLNDEQEARRRDMQDASVTLDRIRQEYQTATEFKSPLIAHKRRSELRSRLATKKPTWDNDTEEISSVRSLATRKHTNALVRATPRGSKRTSSGRIIPSIEKADDKPTTTVRLRRLRTIKEELQKDSPRRSSRPALQEQKQQDNAVARDPPVVNDEGVSRTTLSSERRAAAIARLEQKRAERRRAQGGNALPGKENAGLYEEF